MTVPQSPVLEFPAMLHGHSSAVLRAVRAKGQSWAREYLKTGAFSLPQRMLQVPLGEVLVMHSGADFDSTPRPRWRIHLFPGVFTSLNDSVPEETCQRLDEAFESFCLNTPWGALALAVAPPPPRSAKRMARRLAALLHFWGMLQGPRYAFWSFEQKYTLEELVEDLYGTTLAAWCPGEHSSVRELLSLTVERMARATREECMEAVLRAIPALVEVDTEFKHREVLSDPDFLRERLSSLPPRDFESFSSAEKYTVTARLAAWDRALKSHS